MSLQMVLEEIHQLSQLIQSPFDLSHVVLLGHAHPDPLVQLAAVHCGYTVTRPSAYFSQSLLTSSASPPGMSPSSYSENSLKDNLCSLYSDTGVKVYCVLAGATCRLQPVLNHVCVCFCKLQKRV